MHIRILALVFLFQIQISCQHQQDKPQLQATMASFKTIDTGQVMSGEANAFAENVILQSVDGGMTWSDVGAGLPKDVESGMLLQVVVRPSLIRLMVFSKRMDMLPILYGIREIFPDKRIEEIFPGRASLYGYTAGVGFFTELQGSGIWIHVGNTMEGRSVRTLVEVPDGSVLVGSDTGIYRSTDGCISWKQVFKGDMVSSIISVDKFLFAGGLQGLLRSADGGGHWELIEAQNGRALQIGSIESGVTAIFTGASPYKDSIQNRIKNDLLVSADGGETWASLDSSLPSDQYIYGMVQSGAYLFCSLDSGIYRSGDNGDSWQLVRATKGKDRFDVVVAGKSVYAIRRFNGC
ncbi:MAG: hypothetical protein IPN60_00055 [Saprospiraceae bacterium]|nr:hypothetical protein [Candidatus Opimibacter skivensis]